MTAQERLDKALVHYGRILDAYREHNRTPLMAAYLNGETAYSSLPESCRYRHETIIQQLHLAATACCESGARREDFPE